MYSGCISNFVGVRKNLTGYETVTIWQAVTTCTYRQNQIARQISLRSKCNKNKPPWRWQTNKLYNESTHDRLKFKIVENFNLCHRTCFCRQEQNCENSSINVFKLEKCGCSKQFAISKTELSFDNAKYKIQTLYHGKLYSNMWKCKLLRHVLA